MFENLSEKFDRALQVLKGDHKISEIKIAETAKEIRRVLVDADVNYKIAKDFTDRVKEKAIGARVHTSLNPRQVFIKIVKDELTTLMGGGASDINLAGKPAVILIAGLQGSGKTTFSGKLALFLKSKKNRRVLLVAGDVYRPAAIDQLKVLAEGINVEVYTEEGNKNPVQIAENGIAYAREKGLDTVIVDTAGRLAVDAEMMDEISRIHAAVKPSETLFVVDSMTGQDAVNTAKAFNDVLNFDGVVLTKLDGDTRGGAALSIKATVNKPIKFSSTGEKMEALDVFHPERLADRILGMGDIVSLVEKVNAEYDDAKAKELEKKFRKNQFGFDDFLAQIHQIKKLGNMKDLLGMLPGMGKALKDVDIPDDAFKHVEAIINSMTPEERRNPDIINPSRKSRIARGSGRSLEEVNRLMKQFEDMKKMMKMMSGPGAASMMKMMGGGRGMGMRR
ncbi:MAG: signal recognition particle protein [Flavobacteriales bacterium]|nr:signal recognition particle protein [Flavobacteriales bacterium]